MSARASAVTILGAGPVGLVAALMLLRAGERVTIAAEAFPRAGDQRRVDAVPAAFIMLLRDFGISPESVGVDAVHLRRRLIWTSRTPQISVTPPTAYVERPKLELALFDLLQRFKSVQFDERRLKRSHALEPAGLPCRRLIDATGRAAVTATRIIRPPKPWAARTFWTPRPRSCQSPLFTVVSLPHGYAYRSYSKSYVTLGVVGRGPIVDGGKKDVARYLREFASTFLDESPSLDDMVANRAKIASVQWTEGNHRLRLGDAALARDVLSSQGIVCGISEGLLSSALRDDREVDLIRARQAEQRRLHLRSLLRMIEQCDYADRPVWQDYRAAISPASTQPAVAYTSALRFGRIRRIPLNC